MSEIDSQTTKPDGLGGLKTGFQLTETVVAGKYQIKSVIGSGGQGTVYLADNLNCDPPTQVAIKAIRATSSKDPSAVRRFFREAEVLQQLDHPAIVKCFEFGEEPTAWMALEFVDGPTLSSLLQAERRFSPLRAARIVEQLLEGLSVAHAAKIAHRDLKPSNILFSKVRDVLHLKLLDFGVALQAPASPVDIRLTQPGELVGTPLYIAPERFLSDDGGDVRADVWSVGVILYQLISGQLPFTGDSIAEQIGKMLTIPVPAFASLGIDVDEAFQLIIKTALTPEPWLRYADAAEMLNPIREWLRTD